MFIKAEFAKGKMTKIHLKKGFESWFHSMVVSALYIMEGAGGRE